MCTSIKKRIYIVTFSHSYETINGTAMAGSDYEAKRDVLVFQPGENLKHINITIIDDNEWEENEVFFLKLARFDYKDDTVEIGEQSITEVTIINDDGELGLELVKTRISYRCVHRKMKHTICALQHQLTKHIMASFFFRLNFVHSSCRMR